MKRRKKSLIFFAWILLLVGMLAGSRSWAARSAEQHLVRKYQSWVDADKITVTKVELFRGLAIMDYDGMTVRVDLVDHTDNFAENYAEQRYRDRILAAYPGKDIRLIEFPAIYPKGDLNASDHRFWLEAAFDGTVNSRERLAAAAENLLLAIREAGLTGCDSVEAFAEISGQVYRLRVSPYAGLTATELAERITVMPVSD